MLHKCISENQSAFVPKRAISDNVLITHEALHYLKTSGATKRCFMAVKTGFYKGGSRKVGFSPPVDSVDNAMH